MDQFTLGMDIGITSIGWSVIDTKTNHLVDLGVHLFEEAKPAADAGTIDRQEELCDAKNGERNN